MVPGLAIRTLGTPRGERGIRIVKGALTRYRVMAYVVGVMLLVLVFIAVPLKYLGDNPTLVEVVGPIHGFLYVVYLIFTVDLTFRLRWPIGRMLLIMLAGTIPFMSFVAERWVTRNARARAGTEPAAA
jgi:integral membrane protein